MDGRQNNYLQNVCNITRRDGVKINLGPMKFNAMQIG